MHTAQRCGHHNSPAAATSTAAAAVARCAHVYMCKYMVCLSVPSDSNEEKSKGAHNNKKHSKTFMLAGWEMHGVHPDDIRHIYVCSLLACECCEVCCTMLYSNIYINMLKLYSEWMEMPSTLKCRTPPPLPMPTKQKHEELQNEHNPRIPPTSPLFLPCVVSLSLCVLFTFICVCIYLCISKSSCACICSRACGWWWWWWMHSTKTESVLHTNTENANAEMGNRLWEQ